MSHTFHVEPSRPPRKVCRTCRGAGEVMVQVHLFNSPDDYSVTCSECGGTGEDFSHAPTRQQVSR
jgi:DnaJ-class molecular chaperone